MSELSIERLGLGNLRVPRYTSYPTADRFVEAFGAEQYGRALEQRSSGIAPATAALSLYVHIPFCTSLCDDCAGHKMDTQQLGRADEYMRYLEIEAGLQAARMGKRQSVTHLHLGGGTATFLNDVQLQALMALLHRHFIFVPGSEHAVDLDPQAIDGASLSVLLRLGFNRLSLCAHEFDSSVAQPTHRSERREQIARQVKTARQMGFSAISMELIYGIPRQTAASFERILEQTVELRPDQVGLTEYAQSPERTQPRRPTAAAALPTAAEQADLLAQALRAFRSAGYVQIGMDHFALPADPLSAAKRQGRLHRNFQGYSTQPDCDLIGLGVTALGKMGATYSQNARTLGEYYGPLDQMQLPIVRGVALSRDDHIRRAVIMALMCQGRLEFESIELAWLIDFQRYFAPELVFLQALKGKKWVELDAGGITVTTQGWLVVPAIASVFDRYLQQDRARIDFSGIL